MMSKRAHILKIIAACCIVLALCSLVACGTSEQAKVKTPTGTPTTPASSGEGDAEVKDESVPRDGGSRGSGCSGGGSELAPGEETSGASFDQIAHIYENSFNDSAAVQGSSAAIDVSSANEGYIGAKGTSPSRLKLQVAHSGQTYNYDMPNDGTPVFVPVNMGDGSYSVRVMQNTSGNNYVELLSASANVSLSNEFGPFLHPNLFCNFSETSASTKKARELTANSATQADALRAICEFVVDNVKYDNAKAEQLASATGYIPNPDDTLKTKTGICFDYASLGAAMLRSVGIPAQVVTGYVSPNGLYHAWIMAYIDGTWHLASFSVNPREWSRVDLTYAAAQGGNSYIGDGVGYQDRYIY